MLPRCTSQRSATCATVRPLLCAISPSTGSSSSRPRPSGVVGGENDAACAAGVDDPGRVDIGMGLALQVDQRLRAERDRLVEQRDVEIRHAEVAREPVALGLGERAHGFLQRDLGVRPVHQQEVDIVDAEIGEALVDRAREIGGAQIFVRHLGAEEDVAARHAGRADAFADLALAAVFPCGVDVAIAELERGRDVLAANALPPPPRFDVPSPIAGMFASPAGSVGTGVGMGRWLAGWFERRVTGAVADSVAGFRPWQGVERAWLTSGSSAAARRKRRSTC